MGVGVIVGIVGTEAHRGPQREGGMGGILDSGHRHMHTEGTGTCGRVWGQVACTAGRAYLAKVSSISGREPPSF